MAKDQIKYSFHEKWQGAAPEKPLVEDIEQVKDDVIVGPDTSKLKEASAGVATVKQVFSRVYELMTDPGSPDEMAMEAFERVTSGKVKPQREEYEGIFVSEVSSYEGNKRVSQVRDPLNMKTKALRPLLKEEVNVKEIIKELIDTNWSGSNDEQMKAVRLSRILDEMSKASSRKEMNFLVERAFRIIEESEEEKAKKAINALISDDWGKSNESQGKAVQLFKALSFNDSDLANKFMDKINKFTSNLDKV
jgi:hypothetical protein